ncbi:MAG: hypothetical protein ACXADY_15235 [Candidatus Hodarchaeales archaeon]|jgi:hypothetical protein
MRKQWVLLFGTLLLILPIITLITGINQNSLGVTVGDTFNVEVMENPQDSMEDRERPEGFKPPEEINPKDQEGRGFGFFGLGIDLDNFTLFPIIEEIPSTGTVFAIKVLAIPNGTISGKISVSIRGSTTEYNTDFSYGSPIIFTDWNGWEDVLNKIEADAANSNDNIEKVNFDITKNSDDFQSKITFTMTIPEERQEFMQEMVITQHVRYDKATGIQDLILIETKTTSSMMGEMVQKIQLEFTTKTFSLPDYSSLLLMIGLGGIVVLSVGAFIVNRSRRQTQVVQKALVEDVEKKTFQKEKSQLQDIRDRIAEIEKRDEFNLKKAETSLKNTKKFRRRR